MRDWVYSEVKGVSRDTPFTDFFLGMVEIRLHHFRRHAELGMRAEIGTVNVLPVHHIAFGEIRGDKAVNQLDVEVIETRSVAILLSFCFLFPFCLELFAPSVRENDFNTA